jgi:adenosylmethionine-8-amino-7-oxononanoate aminotransferase
VLRLGGWVRPTSAGVTARAEDRVDTVPAIAPPLICTAAVLDAIVDGLEDVLTAANDPVDHGADAAVSTPSAQIR